MKRLFFLLALLALPMLLPAQERVAERTYISTDKDVFVAGDRIWCSAFCVDGQGRLSAVSSVAYLELHNASTMVANARIALVAGRGAGWMEIPPTLPTGNYRLIAYTAQNIAEEGYDYEGLSSKTLSVYNVLTNERVDGGVEVVTPEAYAGLPSGMGPDYDSGVTLHWENGRLLLENRSGEPVTLSLSVFHEDGIRHNANPGIADFLGSVKASHPGKVSGSRIPDYEGEVIRGRIVGFSEEMIPHLIGKYAFISSPSDKSDVYAAPIMEDGSLTFFTGGIFGNKECICEIEGIDPKLSCHIELFSPYVNPRVAPAPVLKISESLGDALKARSVAMQIERRFEADTLYEYLPRRTDGLFDENVCVRYILDDYTRFTTMEEVFTEFVSEIRPRRRSDGSLDIKIRLADIGGNAAYSSEQTMMMLDGVPVFNQQKILDYDPLLVESIDIYPYTHFIGNRIFEGVANFVTYKRNLPAFRFDSNARVIDYQGLCIPMAVTAAPVEGNSNYPDYRQTLLWQPLLEIEAGGSLTVDCAVPLYTGDFNAVAEGMTASGNPVSGSITFDLR